MNLINCKKIWSVLAPLVMIAGFLVLWQWGSGHYTEEQLPPPATVIEALKELSDEGVLFEHVNVSVRRFASGYLMAAAVAVPLGLLIGRYLVLLKAAEPVIQLLRPISPVAWFPLAVLWFGIGNAPAIFIIFYAAFFPILLATIHGVVNVNKLLLKVAENFGVPEIKIFYKVIIPAAFPHIIMGLNLAAGVAWIHLVSGEMLGAQSGIGFMIVDARNFLRTDMIIAGMLLVGLLGIAVNMLAKKTESLVKRRWGMQDE
jgi:NitT/TauT family transport system permease protein